MSSDNRISAVLSDEDVAAVQAAVGAIRAKLPFLVTLSTQERKELPRMGPKSIGFDEKCSTYMGNRAEFIPGFVDPAEVLKDRTLRAQLLRFAAELQTLADSVDDTLQLVSSEVWMADLAYYQRVREAAHRGRDGAQNIYDDLRRRVPGARGTAAAPEPAAA